MKGLDWRTMETGADFRFGAEIRVGAWFRSPRFELGIHFDPRSNFERSRLTFSWRGRRWDLWPRERQIRHLDRQGFTVHEKRPLEQEGPRELEAEIRHFRFSRSVTPISDLLCWLNWWRPNSEACHWDPRRRRTEREAAWRLPFYGIRDLKRGWARRYIKSETEFETVTAIFWDWGRLWETEAEIGPRLTEVRDWKGEEADTKLDFETDISKDPPFIGVWDHQGILFQEFVLKLLFRNCARRWKL